MDEGYKSFDGFLFMLMMQTIKSVDLQQLTPTNDYIKIQSPFGNTFYRFIFHALYSSSILYSTLVSSTLELEHHWW